MLLTENIRGQGGYIERFSKLDLGLDLRESEILISEGCPRFWNCGGELIILRQLVERNKRRYSILIKRLI
jgi:hypothetical protein